MIHRAIEIYRERGLVSLLVSSANFAKYKLRNLSKQIFRQGTVERYYARYLGTEVRYRGIKLNLASVSPHIIVDVHRGWHESEEANAIEKYLSGREDLDVIELGGFIGFIACYVDVIVPNSKHVVVEPNPEIIPILKQNRKQNGASFEIVNSAYSSNADEVALCIPDNERAASLYKDGNRSIDVTGVNLEQLTERYGISDFVLIADIEGAEVDLINNELDLLETHCKLIIIEFHDDQVNDDLREEIKDAMRMLELSSFERVESFGKVFVYKCDTEGQV